MGLQKQTSTYAATTFPAGTQTRYNANTNVPTSNTTADPIINGPDGAYIGGPTVKGATSGVNAALSPVAQNSQLFVFHNHDDYKATNNGVYPGGMFTMISPTP